MRKFLSIINLANNTSLAYNGNQRSFKKLQAKFCGKDGYFTESVELSNLFLRFVHERCNIK